MIVVHCLVISSCLLAQAADSPSSSVPPARMSPRRQRGAPPANPPAESEPAATEGGGRGRSAYDHARNQDPADRSMHDLDAGGGAGGELGQVDTGPTRARPPELLADALSGPHEGPMPTKALPLVDALARSSDREQQRQIVVAYWRLATAQAQLHYAHGNLKLLREWHQPGHKQSSLTESQVATAEAAIKDAEFRVINVGEALATLVGWPDKDQIPATVDRPHTGAYRTEFETLFSHQTPPPRMRLIHRTLPISRRAIDVHGSALVAASDALKETETDYHDQKAEYLTLAATYDRLIAEQTAFLASVLRYNEDIAEYAFFVAPATADAAFLAKRLITRPAPPSQPHAEQPRAPQPDATEDSFDTNSTQRNSRPRTFRDSRGPADGESREDPSATQRPKARLWLVGVETPAEPSHGGLYQGSIGYEAALQAQQLTAALHWDRELPPDSGDKLTLTECLERTASAKRRAAIAAYWETREQMAYYQALGQRSESLAELTPKLLALRGEPGGAGAMLRLQAAREVAKAAVLDEHIRLLSSQYELLLLLGSPPDRPWPLPSTPPHGGDYTVAQGEGSRNDADQPPQSRQSLGSAATRVVVLHTELAHRAHALVFADEFRARHTPAEPRRLAEIDSVLRAIDRQLRETEMFLGTLTDYNLAVADFVLPLLPPDTSAKGVVEKLVVEPAPADPTPSAGT